MSEAQPPNVGSREAGIADRAIQHQWDRYAMNDFSVEPLSDGPSPAPTPVELTNTPIATRAFDAKGKSNSDDEDSK